MRPQPRASADAVAQVGVWSRKGGNESVTTASHYVVCLECGKKFTYDWSEMRIVR